MEEELCERGVIISQGQVVYDGILSGINHLMGDKKVITLKFAEDISPKQLAPFGRIRECRCREGVLELPREGLRKTMADILSGLPVEDFTVTEVPLEESIALIFRKEAVS